jgi:hypothetical protein
MSLFFYGVCIVGAVLGGLVFLVLYSLVAMAQRGDQYLDQLEIKKPKNHQTATSLLKAENPGIPVAADLYHGGTT